MRGHLRGHGIRVGRHGHVGRVGRRVHGHGGVVHLAVAVLDEEVLLGLVLLLLVVRGLALVEAVLGRGKRRRGAEDARVTGVAANKRRGLRREAGRRGAAGGARMCAREVVWVVRVVRVVVRIVRGRRRELVLRLGGGQRSYVTTIVE